MGDGDGQGGLACCDSWGHKESDTTERLNWTEYIWSVEVIIKHYLSNNSLINIYWHLANTQFVLFSCFTKFWGDKWPVELKVNILEFQALKAVESINRNDWIFFVVLHLKAGHSFSVFLRLAGVCVCLAENHSADLFHNQLQ